MDYITKAGEIFLHANKFPSFDRNNNIFALARWDALCVLLCVICHTFAGGEMISIPTFFLPSKLFLQVFVGVFTRGCIIFC